jgi:hypothetical protein
MLLMVYVLFPSPSSCQEQAVDTERILIIREAEEDVDNSCAVVAYLEKDVLEVKVIARIYSAKPRIENIILVGPRLGRLSPKVKQTLLASEVEDEEFLTKPSRGILFWGKGKKMKKLSTVGAVTRELYKFVIPKKRIVAGQRYELRITLNKMQRSETPIKFKFLLEGFPEKFHQANQ